MAKQTDFVAALNEAMQEKARNDAVAHMATIANTVEARPVGKPTLTDKQREKMHDMGGIITDEAQGTLLAQQIKAITRSVAADLARCAIKAFSLSVHAREACVKELRAWQTQCRAATLENGNLVSAGNDVKALKRIANSATTRVSQFNQCLKAMNAGMTLATLGQRLGIDDPENIGFNVMVAEARKFLSTEATGPGRPADPFAVKLQKWLAKQEVQGDDAELKARVEADLQEYLPANPEAVNQ